MLKPHKNPYGYKNLLAYTKSEDLQKECSHLTHFFPFSKTLASLADQMDRSARSGKQKIVEAVQVTKMLDNNNRKPGGAEED